MPPISPWGKKPKQHNALPLGSPAPKPNLANNAQPKSPGIKSQYEEIQEDELIALASIYGDDFKKVDLGLGAWKVCGANILHAFNTLIHLLRNRSPPLKLMSSHRTKISLLSLQQP